MVKSESELILARYSTTATPATMMVTAMIIVELHGGCGDDEDQDEQQNE